MLRPVLNMRIRVMLGERVAIGPGKVALLEALEETQSINAAAKSMGMSYRRAWILIDELNGSLREPAVVSRTGGSHGGGSEVTDVGRQIIALYRDIEARALAANEEPIGKLLKLTRRS